MEYYDPEGEGGEERVIARLFIANTFDKVVLSALAQILSDKFSELMLESSFACRQDVGVKEFLGKLVGWGAVEALILVDFESSVLTVKKEKTLNSSDAAWKKSCPYLKCPS